MRAAYFCSALANNLPDFDFAYTRIVPGKLGYLLHHRGHTHTVAIGLLLGVIPLVLVRIWARRRAVRFDASDWRALTALSLAGPLLHVMMDFANTYGVHPFWPLWSRWFYGDLLFIVEPYLWAAVLPQLLFATRAPLGKVLLGFLLAMTAMLPWFAGSYVPTGVAIAVAICTALWTFALWRLSRDRAAIAAAVALAAVLGTFLTTRIVARSRMETAI